MRPLILAIIACLAAVAVQPESPPPPVALAQTPLVLSRNRLCPAEGIDRALVYLHSRSGGLATTYTLTPGTGPAITIPRTTLAAVDLPWDIPLHGCLQLPPTIAPGTYTLDAGRGPEATITVMAAPPRKVAFIAAGTEVPKIQQLIAAGFNDLIFSPGYYTFSGTLTLPANCRVRGYGAVVFRLLTNPIGPFYPVFQIGGQDVSVCGFTFVDVAGGATFFANPAVSGLVLADCTFNRCNLGWYFTASLIRDCTFNGGGAIIAPAGLTWRCRFVGPSTQDPMQFWAGLGSQQMLDCTFTATSRGPVFNALTGAINDCLYSGVECHDIVRGNNGNECWLCEGGAINNLLALHCRARGCDSALFQFDGGSENAFARDFAADGGFGIIWLPIAGKTITNPTLQDFQLTRCGIYLGPGVVNPQFIGGAVINWQPTRGNQTWWNLSPLCGTRTAAILLDPSVNPATVSGVPVVGLSPGFSAMAHTTVAVATPRPAQRKPMWPREWGAVPVMRP